MFDLLSINSTTAWIFFNLFILFLLFLDLKVFHRNAHEIHFKEAVWFSVFWISLALIFNAGLYYFQGSGPALDFLTGYLIEKSLSVDNLFVFVLIFAAFKVPKKYQHEVLFWGIVGALVFRAIFIFAGVALIKQFHYVIYLFGAFLVFTGIKLALEKEKEIHPEKSIVIRMFRKLFPVTKDYRGGHFLVKQAGKWVATPLLVVLVLIETTDIIFAVDSIPAILAITTDPFIVYTSNVFAILGLRSLYFALSGFMDKFHHLHYGLAAILVFVGTKMLVADFYKFPIAISLGFIAGCLALSVWASLAFPLKKSKRS
jgi:tellurite resistance protein TerC